MRLSISDFLQLRHDLPVVDVRSEGEHATGHIRGAHNIPILNNDERRQVGTDYKQKGQQEAIRTGFRLVGPRLTQIVDDARQLGNELIVHCWRGGMRSGNFCQFVEMARQKTHQLDGGYKAYRQLSLESFRQPLQLTIIGGYTGSGKSEVLRALGDHGEQIIDLEMLARHKGSVFGGLSMPPQPTSEQFHNDLFEAIIKLDRSKRIWIEDESLGIGQVFLPEPFWSQMRISPIVEIDVDKSTRVERLVKEYGSADRDAFLEAMLKITRKLGGQHFIAAKERLEADDMPATIDILLTYYDKAYRRGLDNKSDRVKNKFHWNGNNVNNIAEDLIRAFNHPMTKSQITQ
ncbi:MAG: tRNA 2-selenouridine(34) synthase MnmH [Chryseolinea sp.]